MAEAAIRTVEMHSGGEPVRLVVDGYPPLEGRTLLDKRRHARQHFDHLRTRLVHEPRGHAGMYGVLLAEPDHPEADLAVLFMHTGGYSTMCGHAVLCLGRWAVESGRVPAQEPETRVNIQCPCGLVRTRVEVAGGRAGAVRFESVPAFALALDRTVEVAGLGALAVDVGYGGAFYAVAAAAALGLDLEAAPLARLTDAAAAVSEAVAGQVPLAHPDDPDLAFLYGTILTDGGDGLERPSRNVCVFAGRQVDRSPTGSGVTARIALACARGAAVPGEARGFLSLTDSLYTGRPLARAACGEHEAVTVEVGGRAYATGTAAFTAEDDDPLRDGFLP